MATRSLSCILWTSVPSVMLVRFPMATSVYWQINGFRNMDWYPLQLFSLGCNYACMPLLRRRFSWIALKLGHGWVITYNCSLWMYLLIHVSNCMLTKLATTLETLRCWYRLLHSDFNFTSSLCTHYPNFICMLNFSFTRVYASSGLFHICIMTIHKSPAHLSKGNWSCGYKLST